MKERSDIARNEKREAADRRRFLNVDRRHATVSRRERDIQGNIERFASLADFCDSMYNLFDFCRAAILRSIASLDEKKAR